MKELNARLDSAMIGLNALLISKVASASLTSPDQASTEDKWLMDSLIAMRDDPKMQMVDSPLHFCVSQNLSDNVG